MDVNAKSLYFYGKVIDFLYSVIGRNNREYVFYINEYAYSYKTLLYLSVDGILRVFKELSIHCSQKNSENLFFIKYNLVDLKDIVPLSIELDLDKADMDELKKLREFFIQNNV